MAQIIISLSYAKDNTDKSSLAFNFATASIAVNPETIMFLSSEGVNLAIQGYADDILEPGFKPLKELLDTFVNSGGQVWVCLPCFNKRGLVEANLIKNASLVKGTKVAELLTQGAACISF